MENETKGRMEVDSMVVGGQSNGKADPCVGRIVRDKKHLKVLKPIKALDDKQVIHVSSGHCHSIVLSGDGTPAIFGQYIEGFASTKPVSSWEDHPFKMIATCEDFAVAEDRAGIIWRLAGVKESSSCCFIDLSSTLGSPVLVSNVTVSSNQACMLCRPSPQQDFP